MPVSMRKDDQKEVRQWEYLEDGTPRYTRATITSRVRRLLGNRADLQKIVTRYPELAPYIPDDVTVPRYLDFIAARLVDTALSPGAIGLAAAQILLDRNDGKLTDKLDISGGLDSTLTVQAFREQLLALSTRSESPVISVQDAVPDDDLESVF